MDTHNGWKTMKAPSFEIVVAVLGHVSVGKTTLLNALFQDYVSEVSRRPTTAGINFFRIIRADDTDKASFSVDLGCRDGDDKNWASNSLPADELVQAAESILAEITADNKRLRVEKGIQEKKFNIQLDMPLCEMYHNTTLVFVDIPGLNEADTKMMYLDYVTEHWDTFDCVIIVMDAEKGISTQAEVDLLEFAKEMQSKKKNVPIIIICNKVDDPDDGSIMDLVKELQLRVEKVFGVDNRTEALDQLLTFIREGKRCDHHHVYPIFIPMSAGKAFAYRAGSNCSFAEFQKLEPKIIDQLGCEEVGGAKWKKMNWDKKCKVAFDAMNDSAQYWERLGATNFDVFLAALAYTVGGSDTQRDLLEKQVEIALRNLPDEPVIAGRMLSTYNICKALGLDPNVLKSAFWNEYEKRTRILRAALWDEVDVSFYNFNVIQLIIYIGFLRQVGWVDDERKVVKEMIALVGWLVGFVIEREAEWKIDDAVIAKFKNCYEWNGKQWERPSNNHHFRNTERDAPPEDYPWHWKPEGHGWRNIYTDKFVEGENNPVSGEGVTWSSLTYHDWVTILGSLLLGGSNPLFLELSGRDKMLLEQLHLRHSMYITGVANGKTSAETTALENMKKFTQGSYRSGAFVPKDPLMYQVVAQVVAPERLSDLSHWGYLPWMVCKFLEKEESGLLESILLEDATDGTEPFDD